MKKKRRESNLHALPGGASPLPVDNAYLLRKAQQLLAEEMATAMQAAMERESEVEYKFSLHDSWSVELFTAVARKYGVTPYRNHGQKSQTLMIRASKTLVDTQLWPEFNELSERLHAALHKATGDLIMEALGQDAVRHACTCPRP